MRPHQRLRSGDLDRKIDIQEKTVTQSDSGFPEESWSTTVARRSAAVKPVRGDERFKEPTLVAESLMEFTIRHSSNVAGLSPLNRIIYPALDSESEDDDQNSRIFDIVSVEEIGRREGLKIIGRARPDIIANLPGLLWGDLALTWGDHRLAWGT